MNYSPQAPPSMGFSRRGYWSGLPFPSPGDLPNPEIKPMPPALGGLFTAELPGRQNLPCNCSPQIFQKSKPRGSVTTLVS